MKEIENQIKIRQELIDKTYIHLHQDYMELTILLFYKQAVKENKITENIQSEYLTNYSLMALIQFGMIGCIMVALLDEQYDLHPNTEFSIVLAKFICSCALHLFLSPHVERSMTFMKFVINHSEYFTDKNVVFCIALSSFWINILAEVINLYMLAYQHNVEHCIIHFVALEVIVEIPHILMGSLTNDKLKNRIWQRFHSLQTTNKGRDFVFSERDMVNKIGRVLYRVARGFYVSILFYFQPFIVMAIYLMMIESGDIIHHH